jgi:FkbM family methyltransferase
MAAEDDMIIRWIRETGQPFEPATTAWMLDVMDGATGAYVDVGASTGWFAVPFAKRGHRVIAFEPNARVVTRLRDNCELNGVTIELHHAAVSDREGEVTFGHNPRFPLTSGGSLEPGRARSTFDIVPCTTLDAVVDEPVHLIKIDVEGHERAVLRGAERLIETHRPALMLEANTAAHQTVLVEWLLDRQYEWVLADERNMLCLPAS